MALDSNIPLAAIGAQRPRQGPADWMQNAYSLKQMMDQSQANDQRMQDEEAMRRAMTIGGKPAEIIDRIKKINLKVGLDMEKASADAQSADFEKQTKAFEFFQKRNDAWKQRLGTVLFAPPERQAELYQSVISESVREGLIPPDAIPPQFDPDWIKGKALETLQFDKQMSEHRAQLDAQHKASLRPLEIQEQQGKVDAQKKAVKVDEFVNKVGKRVLAMQQPDGTITYQEGPEVQQNATGTAVTQTTLALRAVQGDQEAKKALAMLRQQGTAAEPLMAVIGPDGKPVYVPRSQAVGKTPASNREQGRPVTSGDANRVADLDTSLDDLKTLRNEVPEGTTGTIAKIGAIMPNVVTELTGWTGPKQKQAVIDRVKQVIGKALEGGVLRKEDEYKYEKILPTIGDTKEVVKTKLEGLDKAITQRRSTLLDSLDDAGYDVTQFRSRGAAPKTVLMTGPGGDWNVPEDKVSEMEKNGYRKK